MNQRTVVYQGDQTLPPPGDARRDVLKANEDNLAQQAEHHAGAHDVHRVDTSKIEPDREIIAMIDSLQVSNAQPGYKYKWVQDQWPSSAKSLEVRRARSLHIRVNGQTVPTWEIVLHDMKEAPELKQVDGTRRVGDCILMRCRADTWHILQKFEAEKRRGQVEGITSHFDELAAMGRDHGIKAVHGHIDRAAQMNGMQAHNLAAEKFDGMIRKGTIPGAQIPQNRR
jgi:hypothetical protein